MPGYFRSPLRGWLASLPSLMNHAGQVMLLIQQHLSYLPPLTGLVFRWFECCGAIFISLDLDVGPTA